MPPKRAIPASILKNHYLVFRNRAKKFEDEDDLTVDQLAEKFVPVIQQIKYVGKKLHEVYGFPKIVKWQKRHTSTTVKLIVQSYPYMSQDDIYNKWAVGGEGHIWRIAHDKIDAFIDKLSDELKTWDAGGEDEEIPTAFTLEPVDAPRTPPPPAAAAAAAGPDPDPETPARRLQVTTPATPHPGINAFFESGHPLATRIAFGKTRSETRRRRDYYDEEIFPKLRALKTIHNKKFPDDQIKNYNKEFFEYIMKHDSKKDLEFTEEDIPIPISTYFDLNKKLVEINRIIQDGDESDELLREKESVEAMLMGRDPGNDIPVAGAAAAAAAPPPLPPPPAPPQPQHLALPPDADDDDDDDDDGIVAALIADDDEIDNVNHMTTAFDFSTLQNYMERHKDKIRPTYLRHKNFDPIRASHNLSERIAVNNKSIHIPMEKDYYRFGIVKQKQIYNI